MNYDIEPYVGVGPIKFGMPREAVRQALGVEPRIFKKTPLSEMPADAYDEWGIHVHYDPPGVCCAVELAAPAAPTFRGQNLLGRSFGELQEMFRRMDQDLETDASGLTSRKLGVGLYAPFAEESPGEPIESVIVFEKGYFG